VVVEEKQVLKHHKVYYLCYYCYYLYSVLLHTTACYLLFITYCYLVLIIRVEC